MDRSSSRVNTMRKVPYRKGGLELGACSWSDMTRAARLQGAQHAKAKKTALGTAHHAAGPGTPESVCIKIGTRMCGWLLSRSYRCSLPRLPRSRSYQIISVDRA
jgi:hypothetical protein